MNQVLRRVVPALAVVLAMILGGITVAHADTGDGAAVYGGKGGAHGSGWQIMYWAKDTPERNANVLDDVFSWSGWTQSADYKAKPTQTCDHAKSNAVGKYGGSPSDYLPVLYGVFTGDNLGGSGGKVIYNGSPGVNVMAGDLDKFWPTISPKLQAHFDP